MSTIAVDNIRPSAGGTSFSTDGVAKAILVYNQVVPSTVKSDNISSVTDAATGRHTWNLTNAFNDALWLGTGSAGGSGTTLFDTALIWGVQAVTGDQTTSSWNGSSYTDAGTLTDRLNCILSFGDLA